MCRIERRRPQSVLEHETVVIREDGAPLAVVREDYRAELVSFARTIEEQRGIRRCRQLAPER